MQNHNPNPPIIGIIYPGEMGSTLGRLLVEHGFHVITTLEGRSPRTRRLCAEAGLNALSTFAQVVNEAEIVISLVPPDAAIETAEHFYNVAPTLETPPIFVDANSVSPFTMARIEKLMEQCGAPLIDASIHGLAGRLAEQGTLFLSGPGANDFAAMMSGVVRVEALGCRIGAASMFKMMLSGIAKGLVGLFVESGLAAREAGMLEQFIGHCRYYYPGWMEAVERMLPTLPRHVRRRAAEMEEVERTIQSLGIPPDIAAGSRHLYHLLGERGLPEHAETHDLGSATVSELMELIGSAISVRRSAVPAVKECFVLS
jgi:3-hydroxyisobutyrate dehydrogenase-like beta-hydroxyacid dehydrogenase